MGSIGGQPFFPWFTIPDPQCPNSPPSAPARNNKFFCPTSAVTSASPSPAAHSLVLNQVGLQSQQPLRCSLTGTAQSALACPASRRVHHGLIFLAPGSKAPGLLLTTGLHILCPLQTPPGFQICPYLTLDDYKVLNFLLACPCP